MRGVIVVGIHFGGGVVVFVDEGHVFGANAERITTVGVIVWGGRRRRRVDGVIRMGVCIRRGRGGGRKRSRRRGRRLGSDGAPVVEGIDVEAEKEGETSLEGDKKVRRFSGGLLGEKKVLDEATLRVEVWETRFDEDVSKEGEHFIASNDNVVFIHVF